MRETQAEKILRSKKITDRLIKKYGENPLVFLEGDTDWKFLFAVILSAQCTDERVNIVTRDLFKKYKTLEDIACASQKDFEKDIYSTGFYHNKAKNIIACAKILVNEYGGELPRDFKDLCVYSLGFISLLANSVCTSCLLAIITLSFTLSFFAFKVCIN